jgi:hypothetical protein
MQPLLQVVVRLRVDDEFDKVIQQSINFLMLFFAFPREMRVPTGLVRWLPAVHRMIAVGFGTILGAIERRIISCRTASGTLHKLAYRAFDAADIADTRGAKIVLERRLSVLRCEEQARDLEEPTLAMKLGSPRSANILASTSPAPDPLRARDGLLWHGKPSIVAVQTV